MDRNTAINYADMFGGEVVCAVRKKGWMSWLVSKVTDRGIRHA